MWNWIKEFIFIDEEKARTHHRKCAARKFAEELGIEPGDVLLEIDGQVIGGYFLTISFMWNLRSRLL